MRYAVNVAESMSLDGLIRDFLLAPVIQSKIVVNAEPGRMDGSAVVLDCPEERAEAIVETIRKRYPQKNLYRIYRQAEGRSTWERV